MVMNTLKCNRLTPLSLKGLNGQKCRLTARTCERRMHDVIGVQCWLMFSVSQRLVYYVHNAVYDCRPVSYHVCLFVRVSVCLSVCLCVCVCVSVVLGLEPTFDSASANVTVTAGQTALLPCFITYLGKYKVHCTLCSDYEVLVIT